VVGSVRKRTAFALVGGLLGVGLAAAVLVGLMASSPASAYKGTAPVKLESWRLVQTAGGDWYITLCWDTDAGRPRYYNVYWEYSDGALAGETHRLSPRQIKSGTAVLGPFSGEGVSSFMAGISTRAHKTKFSSDNTPPLYLDD
jgi:hypothetical protein